MVIRQKLHNFLNLFGYDIHKVSTISNAKVRKEPFTDMQAYVKSKKPVVLDVGANEGQTVNYFKQYLPDSIIHSFEPSPTTYQSLVENTRKYSDVTTWNNGVGSVRAILPFKENVNSDMSSFKDPSELCWGTVEKVTNVNVITLDDFAQEHEIKYIDVLKSDTQGYEYEVFKGSERLMKEGRIGLIYFEYIFSDMYKNIAPFHDTFKYLTENNFVPVSFYNQNYQEGLLSWADVLFVKKNQT